MRWLLIVAVIFGGACQQGAGDATTGSATGAPPTAAAPTSSNASTASVAASIAGHVPPSPSASASVTPADPSRLALEGKAIQGGLVHARVEKGTRGIRFPGHRVIISPDGELLIAFYRNAPTTELLTVTFPDGAQLEHRFQIEQRTFADDRIDNLPERFVKLDAATKKKLFAANKRIEAVRKRYSPKPYYRDGFVWPAHARITSRYGLRRYLNGTDGGIHWGVDIAVPVGTPVRAPSSGRVVFAEHAVPLAGDLLIIDHGQGLSSALLHLSRFAVKVGDEVKKGDVVARSGMTGRANGAHLDWRVNLFTIRLDPELLVEPMGAK